MKTIIFTTFLFIFCSCSLSSKRDKNLAMSIPPMYKVDSIPRVDSAPPANKNANRNNCIFDTSTYKFTTTILREYDSTIVFFWDDSTKEAIIKVDKDDTLKLHVGGCNHFLYSIVYTTKGSLFNKDDLLAAKAKWLAQTFLREGFETWYVNGITSKQYEIDKSEPGIKYLTITNKDKDINIGERVYEPVNFEMDGNRTKISLQAYKNNP